MVLPILGGLARAGAGPLARRLATRGFFGGGLGRIGRGFGRAARSPFGQGFGGAALAELLFGFGGGGQPFRKKRRRMNVLNPRALNRALRRVEGFERMVKRSYVIGTMKRKKGKSIRRRRRTC